MITTPVFIVAIVFGWLALMKYFNHQQAMSKINESQSAENEELREQVKQLTERVAVLEKIVTDSSYQVNQEFQKL
ncbi:hypothetical protein [Vibrio mexicanus]|uniref:hypothetical protein n=1 Tax=Vibrio mexicanus TaxID=1004326 RepID=UPI00063CB635|nr:hypothetical protein [Vibrio mexicanus]